MEASLYQSYHINFSHSCPRAIMEELALGAVKTGAAESVSQVFDQYVSFMSLDAGLFSLGLPRTYVELNDPSAQDYHIEVSPYTCSLVPLPKKTLHLKLP